MPGRIGYASNGPDIPGNRRVGRLETPIEPFVYKPHRLKVRLLI